MKRLLAPAVIVVMFLTPLLECIGAPPQLPDVLKKPQRITLVGESNLKRWLDVALTEADGVLKVEESWDTGTVVTTFLPYNDIFAVDNPHSLDDKQNAQIFSLSVHCVHAIHQEILGAVGTDITTRVDHFKRPYNEFEFALLSADAAKSMFSYLTERRSGGVTVDCGTDRRKSCLSFSEMLKARDKEIMELVTNLYKATYVCFRPEENLRPSDDSFLVLYYDEPAQDNWDTMPGGRKILMNNHLSITEYENGLSSARPSPRVRLKWTDPSNADHENGGLAPVQDMPELFYGYGFNKPIVSINDSEISVSYSYRNVNNRTVEYGLQIRKATRRFVETLDQKNPYEHYEFSGSCAAFGLASRSSRLLP